MSREEKTLPVLMELPEVGKLHTQFSVDRLRETSWEDRSYISMLVTMEEIALAGGPTGFAAGVWLGGKRREFQVEWHCIWHEIQDGVYSGPEEFRRLQGAQLLKEAEARERERREEAFREQQARINERLARDAWRIQGGLG